jgi:ribosomal protein L9
MAQNFGMMANYGEPKDKAKSSTTGAAQQLEGHPAEPEVKKPRVKATSCSRTQAIGQISWVTLCILHYKHK